MDEAGPSRIDEETLDRLRRGIPLRMTAMGELLHGGEPIAHAGVRRAFRHGLDVTEDGEPIMRLGPQWCYLTVDDCPLRATSASVEHDGITIRLDDDRVVTLDPTTLWEEPGKGLRCTAPSRHSGRPLDVRFTNAAQVQLAEHVETDGDGDGSVLRIGALSVPIGTARP